MAGTAFAKTPPSVSARASLQLRPSKCVLTCSCCTATVSLTALILARICESKFLKANKEQTLLGCRTIWGRVAFETWCIYRSPGVYGRSVQLQAIREYIQGYIITGGSTYLVNLSSSRKQEFSDNDGFISPNYFMRAIPYLLLGLLRQQTAEASRDWSHIKAKC